MSDTLEAPTVGSVIEYSITPADTSLIDAGETVPFMVTESNPDTGVYGGYAFLPGGAGIPFVRVDPTAPAPTPVPSASPTLADLVNEVKGDQEFMEFLAWKDSQKSTPTPTPTPDPEPEPTPEPPADTVTPDPSATDIPPTPENLSPVPAFDAGTSTNTEQGA